MLSLALSLVVLGGCTGSGVQSSSGSSGPITEEEIQQMGSVSNAYSLVQQLRPNWLQKRGSSSISAQSDIIVYVEGSRRGRPTALRQIQVTNIQTIRFLRPDRATMRYGSGHDHGVIEVVMKEG